VRLRIIFPTPADESRWSSRDNDVLCRLGMECHVRRSWLGGELFSTAPTVRKFRNWILRLNIDLWHPDQPGHEDYFRFGLGHEDFTLDITPAMVDGWIDAWGARQHRKEVRVANDDEARALGSQHSFQLLSTPNDPQCFLDVKWGADSPRWLAKQADDVTLQIFRRKGNHVNPWRCDQVKGNS